MFCVYCHTNKKNGKKYVGITSQKPEQRWNNGKGYIANDDFYKDIQKYGWSGFEHEIVADNLTQKQATQMEADLIKKWDCLYSGYNRDRGGRFGKKGFLSSECTIIKNNLKRYTQTYSYLQEYLDLFEQGNIEKRIGDWLNEMVNAIYYKMNVKNNFGISPTNEMGILRIIEELSYCVSIEYCLHNKIAIPGIFEFDKNGELIEIGC